MAQQLSDILASLDGVYNPQKQAIQAQIDQLPAQQQAAQAGLDATKTNAFNDINVQANNRGLSYSGMPIAEQAKYLGATYLPAVANLRDTYANKGFGLQQSLLGLNADERKQAQSSYDTQYAADQAAAAQAANRAAVARASSGGGLYGGGTGATPAVQAGPPAPDISSLFGLKSADAVKTLFNGYDPTRDTGYTEHTVIPALTQYFAARNPKLGTEAQTLAGQLAYNYRKQAFGE